MNDELVLRIGGLLLLMSIVAMLSRRLRLPYSVGLVLAGIGLAIAPWRFSLPLDRTLIFTVLLPPLIFEAALQLEWRAFRRDLPVSLLLAFPGVAVAAGAVAAGAHYLLGWSWIGAGLFGVLIAATDPVSVVATFRELKIRSRLSLLVESESLLNDGAAAVGFAILLSLASGAAATPSSLALAFLWTVVGGIAAGALVAGALLLLAWRTDDHLVEITLTTVAAYGSFLVADHFEMSGVLATLTAGLLFGNLGGKGPISEDGRGHVHSFWDYAAFIANSFVFILIGGHEARQPLSAYALASGVMIALALVGRALAVYPLCCLVARSRLRVPVAEQHILFWGGLRGALALALALAVPASVAEREAILVVAFAVVAFSIFVQGLTMPLLMRQLGIRRGP